MYSICFLAYSGQLQMVQKVIAKLPKSDINYILMECNLESQGEAVQKALDLGCELFVSGPGHAAEFTKQYQFPIVEIPVHYIDYAMAIKKGMGQCQIVSPKIAIAVHRFSAAINVGLLEQLMNVSIELIFFEDSEELRERVAKSDCPILIGATLACDIAKEMGKEGVLVYAGEEAIYDTCLQAANLVRKIYASNRNKTILRMILDNSQLGMILTDDEGKIELFNQTAQKLTGISLTQAYQCDLVEFLPNLSIDVMKKNNQHKSDHFRLIHGAMMHCVQERIFVNGAPTGFLITFYPSATTHKKKMTTTVPLPLAKNSRFISKSPAMKKVLLEVEQISGTSPITILGKSGCNRTLIAQHMHISKRPQKPCIVLDLATIAHEDASRILFGYEKNSFYISGILTNANEGTVILKNLHIAHPIVQGCILNAIKTKQIFALGMEAPLQLNILYILISEQEALEKLSTEAYMLFSATTVSAPTLQQRKEDIIPLFQQYLSGELQSTKAIPIGASMKKLIQFYGWSGNLLELERVCKQYARQYQQLTKITEKTLYLLLIQAIGEDKILGEILAQYPILPEESEEYSESMRAGILCMKEILKFSNATIAEKLGISRTTLWRILK